jgi:excisionase family DNA binding protein
MTAQQALPEHLLTPAQVAALVFVDPKTVSRWATAGKIPTMRTPGGHRRFRESDVQVLMTMNRSLTEVHDEAVGLGLDLDITKRGGLSATREVGRDDDDALVADALAIATAAQAEPAEEAVVETAARLAEAAELASAAAVKAREARALAAAEAAQVVAGQAASAAAAMRSRATAQAACAAKAATQAQRHVRSSGIEGQTPAAAARMAATVQAAVEAASADAAVATVCVAQAVAVAAARVEMMVEVLDLACEKETAAAAKALRT